jgi:hypothetical protein
MSRGFSSGVIGLSVAALLIGSFAPAAFAQANRPKLDSRWMLNYSSAKVAARQSDKPIMLVFR